MRLIGRDLEGYLRALDAPRLPPPGKAPIDPLREAARATADDRRQCRHLPIVRVFIDIKAGNPACVARPQIARPPTDPHQAQIVEIDIAVATLADMPEQHRLAKAVIRCLGEGAWAGNRTAAIVEPVANDVPAGDIAHQG